MATNKDRGQRPSPLVNRLIPKAPVTEDTSTPVIKSTRNPHSVRVRDDVWQELDDYVYAQRGMAIADAVEQALIEYLARRKAAPNG